ncbi:MAG: NUDIX domain-containing protein [Treponema sp.]|nr:NUDIX domain-containing protein [Treponema sp.]MBR7080332.1 NUDIX domain-containing protein [Treponema sp.]
MSKVSIAGIAHDGRNVLIAHRNPTGQMGGRWEFPGGKVDGDESDGEALTREFREEFGIDVIPGQQVATAFFYHNGEKVDLHAYSIQVPHKGDETPYVLSEHTEYKWVDIDSIEGLDFVDSDRLIYPSVRSFILNGD